MRLHGLEREVVIIDRVSNDGSNTFLVEDPAYGRFEVRVEYHIWQMIDVNTRHIVTFDPEGNSSGTRIFGPRSEIAQKSLWPFLIGGTVLGLIFGSLAYSLGV